MTAGRCVRCGTPTAEAWHTLCRACYAATPAAATRRELHALREHVAILTAENVRLRDQLEQRSASPFIDPGFLRRLLQLVHPDRHEGSPLATEVTRELLALRDVR
jgi:hypothetical protein